MLMLMSIDQLICYWSLVLLKLRMSDDIYKGLYAVLRNYYKTKFTINTIHCYGEFKELINKIKSKLDISLNYTAKHKYMLEAE